MSLVLSSEEAVIPACDDRRAYAGSNRRRTPDLERVIGHAMRSLRKREGLTLADVASDLGVTYQSIQRFEIGKARVSLSAAICYCRSLGVPLSDLTELVFEAEQVGTQGNARSEPNTPANGDSQ